MLKKFLQERLFTLLKTIQLAMNYEIEEIKDEEKKIFLT